MKVRFANEEDAAALLELYAQYIDTPITFEYALPSVDEFASRIREITAVYPYLVCEESDRIIGYAYAHRQRERAAYGWNAELTVYLDRDWVSEGIGTMLYSMVMEILVLQKVKTAYAYVALPNRKSEGLHERLGFLRAGVERNAGYKCGSWHGLACFERALAPYDADPAPVIPVGALPKESLDAILAG